MNFKFLKVFLSALLVIACVLPGFSSTASASENGVMKFDDGVTAKTLVDNVKEKVVETNDGKNIYRATFNKESEELIVDTYDLEGNIIVEENISEMTVQRQLEEDVTAKSEFLERISTDRININNNYNMLANSGKLLRKAGLGDSKESFGYWIYDWTPNIWVIKIRNGVSKNPKETSANRLDLNGFKSSTDKFVSNKDQLVAKVGAGIIATIVTLYLVPEPTWTKILAALLTIISSALAYAEGKAMFDSYADARYYYYRVKM